MTKIDELIDLVIGGDLGVYEMIDRLADMLALAIEQRDDWIEMFNETLLDAGNDIRQDNAELEKIAKGEK